MSTVSTKTRDEMIALLKAVTSGQIPDADVSEGSDYDLTAKLLAAAFMGNQSSADFLGRQVIGDESVGEFLDRHLRMRGITKPLATKSVGKVYINAGSPGETQPIGSVLTAPDGTRYVTTAAGVTATPTVSGSPAVAEPVSRTRIVVRPNANTFAVDDPIVIGGVTRAIRDVGPPTGGKVWFDVYERFPTDPSGAITAGTGVVVPIESEEVGLDTMKDVGTVLTLETPGHVDITAATILQEISGGRDDALEGELQALVAAYNAQRPQAGNAQYYRELALRTPGVGLADAVIYPNYRGLGAHDLIVIDTLVGERRVGPELIALVQAWLDSFGFNDHILVGNFVPQDPEDVTVTVQPAIGFEPDFAPTTFTVDTGSSDADAGLLVFSAGNPITAGVEIGDRVCFSVTDSKPSFQHLKVIALSSNSVTLESAIPSLTDITLVRPGGPLVDAIQAALVSLFDTRGPGTVIAAGGRTRRHPPASELWYEQLTVAELTSTVLATEGCRNVTVSAPAADLVANNKEVITLGHITVIHDLS